MLPLILRVFALVLFVIAAFVRPEPGVRAAYHTFRLVWGLYRHSVRFAERRLLIRVIEETPLGAGQLDALLRIPFASRVLDKGRRRRMAVWKARAVEPVPGASSNMPRTAHAPGTVSQG
jgi:hypothetical protein